MIVWVDYYLNRPFSCLNFAEFLTPSLTEKLNPLCVTIIAAEDLPNHRKYELMGTWKDGANPRTMSITELREECKPAYCKYSLMPPQPPPPKRRKIGGDGEEEEDAGGEEEVEETEWNRDVITPSMPQDKNVISATICIADIYAALTSLEFIRHFQK